MRANASTPCSSASGAPNSACASPTSAPASRCATCAPCRSDELAAEPVGVPGPAAGRRRRRATGWRPHGPPCSAGRNGRRARAPAAGSAPRSAPRARWRGHRGSRRRRRRRTHPRRGPGCSGRRSGRPGATASAGCPSRGRSRCRPARRSSSRRRRRPASRPNRGPPPAQVARCDATPRSLRFLRAEGLGAPRVPRPPASAAASDSDCGHRIAITYPKTGMHEMCKPGARLG